MRKFMIFILLLGTIEMGWAQDGIKKQAKDDLLKLSNEFILKQKELKIQDSIFKSLTAKITFKTNDSDFVKLKEQQQKIKLIHKEIDGIYTLAQNYIVFYKSKFTEMKDPEEVLQYFKHTYQTIDTVNNEKEEVKTLLYFGKDKVIEEQDGLFKDKKYNLIFNDMLETKSESYLGDFIIPQSEQIINSVHIVNKNKEAKELELLFKTIKIHIVDGSLYDIQLFVTDKNNNEFLFENIIPISLLRATTLFPKNYLFFKTVTSNNKDTSLDINEYLNYRIKLSDVLVYIPNPGDNYVPEDLTLEFPTKTNGVPDNNNNSIKYKVNQNTSLQNIVELRTYTDFLGLFSDSPNGIVQIEGKADFFVLPFNYLNISMSFLKRISPFVQFSKIEKDVRNLNLISINNSTSTIKNPLEILEKSYLKMGLNLSLISYRIQKEFPFDLNFYGTAKYQISDVLNKDSIHVNYKSLGLGVGVAFEFKRYNNFGFIYSAEFTNYNADSFNEIEGIINPKRFWVFKNEAEVYYFPGETKQQAVFLRLKTFNNSTKNNNETFYQLQFGYRFAIGVNKLKQ